MYLGVQHRRQTRGGAQDGDLHHRGAAVLHEDTRERSGVETGKSLQISPTYKPRKEGHMHILHTHTENT